MAVPSRPVDCELVQRPLLTLQDGRTRLRVVNVGYNSPSQFRTFIVSDDLPNRAMAGLNISLPNSHMDVIQIDGGNVIRPISASEIGILYPGERVDIIVSSVSAANISITLDAEYVP